MQKQEIIREVLGLLLFMSGVFLLVCLITSNPADPPSPLSVGTEPGIKNACGRLGALLSFYLFRYTGIFAPYVAALICMLWGGALFAKRPITEAWIKALAAAVLMLSISTLERLVFSQSYFSDRLVGGYYGTFFAEFLKTNVGGTGAYLTVSSLLVLSFVLSTNLLFSDLLVHLFTWLKEKLKNKKEESASAIPAFQPAYIEPEEIKKKEETPKLKPSKSKKRQQEDAEEEKPVKIAVCDKEGYSMPPVSLLNPSEKATSMSDEDLSRTSALLEQTLVNFGINAKVVGTQHGPSLTMYELSLAPGVTVSSICSRGTDISVALGTQNVRIVAPIPGKNTIGVEVPNRRKINVYLRDFIESPEMSKKKYAIPLFLGRDTSGNLTIGDLTKMPHLLVAGATGSGKSVCLGSIIMSILYTKNPEEVKMILIDPKRVEFSIYEEMPHLYHPVVTDMRKASVVLNWAMKKMEERYEILSALGVRNIQEYNSLGKKEREQKLENIADEDKERLPEFLPYVVIVIDELSDLLLVARKDVEMAIVRLAQKSRAVGIHLIVATQRPCVDVISGHIKANMPSRIAFRVTSMVDSRTILDQNGAELLLGSGDMLYLYQGAPVPARAQGTYISTAEVERTTSFLRDKARPEFDEELAAWEPDSEATESSSGSDNDSLRNDEKYEEAVMMILTEQRGSVSLLQRKLGLGYGRASRFVDFMAQDGILGQADGSKPREVLISLDQWLAKKQAEQPVASSK
ncbi:MAG: DNA translocase FtsK [Planctomycetota bacterium]